MFSGFGRETSVLELEFAARRTPPVESQPITCAMQRPVQPLPPIVGSFSTFVISPSTLPIHGRQKRRVSRCDVHMERCRFLAFRSTPAFFSTRSFHAVWSAPVSTSLLAADRG